jgi:Ca-activated chloride channel family protein
MRQLVRYLLSVIATAAIGLAFTLGHAVAAERVIIVLDGSGSMWAQIDGVPRISIARDTLRTVLGEIPEDLELGLMTYGHRERGNCADIELLVPAGAGTADAITAAADAINPRGMTPISDAVRLAAEELRYTEERATVILITDGLETCEVDPCQLASELEGLGIDFTTHVVGFGLSDAEGQQVACLAENTGGRYIQAENQESLISALNETVAEVAEPEPASEPEPAPEPEQAALEHNLIPTVSLSEDGETIDFGQAVTVYPVLEDGSAGEPAVEYGFGLVRFGVPAGDYIVEVRLGGLTQSQPVSVSETELAEPHFVLNAGIVNVRAFAVEGEPVDSGAALNIYYDGGEDYGFGQATFYVPAGEQRLAVRVGQGAVEETFTIAAGETVNKDIVVGVGRATLNAAYVEGMKVEDGGLFGEVFAAETAIDGTRQSLEYGYGPDQGYDLPPGDYVAVLRIEEASVEVPFTVEAGEAVAVEGMLDAGVAAISAEGATSIVIESARADIAGNRQEFGYAYGSSMQRTLPAGDYRVRATVDGSEREAAFTVVAGERTEVMVE